MEQRTTDWHQARLGKVTASQIHKVFTGGSGITRRNYMQQLLAERIHGIYEEGYMSDAMLWGTETEPHARRAYEAHWGVSVREVGFIDHPTIQWSGASPDGVIGDEGLLEIKCPNTDNHLKTIAAGAVPRKYHMQIQWQLACTGRDWCDFVSYDPRAPRDKVFFIKRLHADRAEIKRLEDGVTLFLAELDRHTLWA